MPIRISFLFYVHYSHKARLHRVSTNIHPTRRTLTFLGAVRIFFLNYDKKNFIDNDCKTICGPIISEFSSCRVSQQPIPLQLNGSCSHSVPQYDCDIVYCKLCCLMLWQSQTLCIKGLYFYFLIVKECSLKVFRLLFYFIFVFSFFPAHLHNVMLLPTYLTALLHLLLLSLLPLACEDGASWCPNVHAGQCYSVLDICCQTCALAQTNVQGLHSAELLFIHSKLYASFCEVWLAPL